MQEDSEHSLKQGSILKNFKIIRVLGAGGFGITYLAKDIDLNLEVVIKEYFPNEFAIRKNDSTIIAKTSSGIDFTKGKKRFKEEAQILAKFNHPSIVKILGYFESNNTAYFVMEYEEGIDLAQYIKQKSKPFNQEEIISIIMPILEGLKEVHRYNYLHRDIKPGNILLKKNSSPVLIDFGATRIAVNDEQSKSVTSMLTEGYAPFEQYSTDIKQQGPFTDIYGIGAVIYKMITLETPVSSQTRIFQDMQHGDDPLNKLSMMDLKGYDPYFLKSIDKALESKPNMRQQSVEVLQSDIAGKINTTKIKPQEIPKKSNGFIVTFVMVCLLTVSVYFYTKQDSSSKDIAHNIVIINNKMWQDEPYTEEEEKAYSDNSIKGKSQDWKGAVQYCKDLTLGGYSDWRLPSINTLEELYAHKSKIKNVTSSFYWSSSIGVDYSNGGYLYFRNGSQRFGSRNRRYYVRCVRDGQ